MLNGPDSNLFCPDPGPIRHGSIFFFFRSVSLHVLLSKTRISIEERIAYRAEICEQIYLCVIVIELPF